MQEEPKDARFCPPKTGFGFRQADKLHTAAHYRHVFAGKPHAIHHKHCLLLYKSRACPPARLGLAISKKHCKRAVDRNRIKRIIREQFRMQQAKLKPCDVVFVSKPGLAKLSHHALHAMAAGLLEQLV